MSDDAVFDDEQWTDVLSDRPALVTAEQLGRLFGIDESEILDLARQGLVAAVGALFDAKLSTQRYCAHLTSAGLH